MHQSRDLAWFWLTIIRHFLWWLPPRRSGTVTRGNIPCGRFHHLSYPRCFCPSGTTTVCPQGKVQTCVPLHLSYSSHHNAMHHIGDDADQQHEGLTTLLTPRTPILWTLPQAQERETHTQRHPNGNDDNLGR